MKKGGGILAILAGEKPKKKAAETDLDEDYEGDDLDDEVDPIDDLDDEDGEVDAERQEVADRLFDAFESRDHAALWSALGDAVDMMRGG